MKKHTRIRKGDEYGLKNYGHLEKEARRLCELFQENPDEFLEHGASYFSKSGSGFHKLALRYSPRWLFRAKQIDDYLITKRQTFMMEYVLMISDPHYPCKLEDNEDDEQS